MAFATTSDVSARLGRTLTSGEETTVEFLLDGAAAIIADAAGQTEDYFLELDPVPPILLFVSVEVACRALANPNGLDSLSETVGANSYSVRFRDAGLGLTRDERRQIRALVRSIDGTGTFATVTLESPYSGTAADDLPDLPL